MTALLGRDRQMAILDTAVARTLSSHGGLVFVTGEAGIGKTVLVAEAAAAAERRGALVATGACWDREGAPSYWPWVQVLRGLRRTMTPEEWGAACGAAGSEISSLLGEAHPGSAGGDGFGLHDAVTTLLVTAARRHPLVVVLDDLHWADPPSVRLLEFVTRHAWFEQLLVVGVYRDVEVESGGHPLGPLLLPLLPKATSMTLTELGPGDVHALLARTAGREPSPGLVAEVHRRTGGNPFFVEQTARLWQSTNSVDAVAPGVRDAVERRLGLLPKAVVELLAGAAVLGPEFDREVLAEMTRRPGREVDMLLAEAVAARLVIPRSDPGRLAFVHDLVRETLYENLDEADARRWHAAAFRALEALPASAARAAPGEAAHHAYLGAPEVAISTAVAMLRAAAEDAWGRLASGEASVHLARAQRLIPKDDAHEWAAVALDLGSAQHHVGDEAAALRTFQEVAAVAREGGNPLLLVRAALRLRVAVWLVHPPEAVRLTADLVNEAHTALVGTDGVATTDLERERELTARAIELARAAGDDVALVEGLLARHDAIWSLGTAVERQAIAEELNVAALRQSDRSVVLLASLLRAMALLEQGDPASLIEQRPVPARTGDPGSADSSSTALWTRVVFAILSGRFDEARRWLEEAEEIERGNRADAAAHGDLAASRFQQRWTLELAQGRFDAADALVHSVEGRDHPCPDLLLAVVAAERGDIAVAERLADRIATAGEPLSRWFEPLWLRLRAQLAAAGDAVEARAQVRAELVPLTGHWLTMFGSSIDGPVVFWTALLDAADGKWDDAVEGFVAARRAADRLEARPWSVRARHHLAKALTARGGPGDVELAVELADAVARDAAELGVAHLVPLRTTAPPTVVSSPSDTFRFDGKVWTLTYEGVTVHMPDAKGLRDLHGLLGRPGTDVPAADLLSPAGGDVVRSARRLGADPVLDERAKSAYRTRLTRLDEQIDAALDRGADERAAELDREREALLAEVRRATGLRGRSRRLGDDGERTRKAVTERIRNTLRRLDERHPALAEHLRQSVSTGSTCRYDPPEPIRWAR